LVAFLLKTRSKPLILLDRPTASSFFLARRGPMDTPGLAVRQAKPGKSGERKECGGR